MKRSTFVLLTFAAFGLILLSFILMGFGRIVLPYRTARLLAAPTLALASVLVLVLLVRSTLAVLGIRELEADERED